MQKIALSIGFFLWALCSQAQFTVLFEDARYEEHDVAYIAEPDSSQAVSNHFIREIARSIPRRFDYTAFKYTYKQVLRVITTEKGKYEVNIDLNEAKCKGDVIYKDFDISDVLFPNRISMKATLLNKYKQTVQVFDIVQAPLHWGYNKVAEFRFSDTIREPVFTFQVSEQRIFYDSSALAAFAEKQRLIDQYYLSKAMIQQGMKKLESFNFSNVDMILVYDILLKDVERQVEELFSYDFPGKLSLSGHDPIGFIDQFTLFSEKTREVRAREDACLATLDQIYYERGMKFLAQEDVPRAVLYFKRSFNYNHYYVPSHYQYARVLFVHDSVEQAADIISEVLRTMNPEPAMHDSVLRFGEHIYRVLLQQGRDHLQLEKYNEALSVSEKAIAFCSNSPGIQCTDEIFNAYASAKFGLYKSYLSVAERAIQSSKYELAEVYIAEARKYQQENSKEIIGDAAADVVCGKLVQALSVKADTLNGRAKFETALQWCERAQRLCETHPGVPRPDDLDRSFRKAYNGIWDKMLAMTYAQVKAGRLDDAAVLLDSARAYQQLHGTYITYTIPADTIDRRIHILRYGRCIAEGMVMSSFASYRPAWALFLQARDIEGRFSFKRDPRLDSLLQSCARPVAAEDLARAREAAEAHRFGICDSLVAAARAMIKSAGLERDSFLMPEALQVERLLFDTRCGFAADSLEYLTDLSNARAAAGNYSAALDYCRQALTLARQFPQCKPDTLALSASAKRFVPASEYEALMSSANEHLKSADTAGYLDAYRSAEAYYADHQLALMKIVHQALIDRCLAMSHAGFLRQAVRHFLRFDAAEEAIRILYKLESTAILPEFVNAELTETGKALGIKDRNADPTAKASEKVRVRTRGSKWFNSFRSAYLKAWKS